MKQSEAALKAVWIAVVLALVLALVPAFVLAQAGVTAECPEAECHVAPFFKGTGGFVGQFNPEAMADGEPLTTVGLVVTCGNVTTTAQVEPAADGTVAHLFDDMNGLACYQDSGEIQIHGLMDGAWYWIHDEMNSAVSNLLPKGALRNMQTLPFDASGGDITMTKADNATLVKDTASGRVGILPHVLPAALPAAATVCGGHEPSWVPPDIPIGPLPSHVRALRPNTSAHRGCLLTGDYTADLTLADGTVVADGATITRGATSTVLTVSLGSSGGTIDITRYWTGLTSSTPFAPRADFHVTGPGGTGLPDSYAGSIYQFKESIQLPIPAVDAAALMDPNDPCRSGSQHRDQPITVVVRIESSAHTLPGFGKEGPSVMYHVACPTLESALPNRGVELVPDNPFPVD